MALFRDLGVNQPKADKWAGLLVRRTEVRLRALDILSLSCHKCQKLLAFDACQREQTPHGGGKTRPPALRKTRFTEEPEGAHSCLAEAGS